MGVWNSPSCCSAGAEHYIKLLQICCFPTALKLTQRLFRELKQIKGTILHLHTSLVLDLKCLILTLINLANINVDVIPLSRIVIATHLLVWIVI